jgi:two-component system chemotaxis sensor kinase CheA
MVARLEEIPAASVERAAGREVVQYRGDILPLIDVESMLSGTGRAHRASPLQVIVYAEHGRSVGLIVAQILDTVETSLANRQRSTRDGVLGSAVVQGKVTDILDVAAVIRRADPGFFAKEAC